MSTTTTLDKHTGDAKSAALLALASLPPFEPVASVSYQSAGRLLIIGGDATVDEAVVALGGTLSVAVFWTAPTPPPGWANAEVSRGDIVSLDGYLGAFALTWRSAPQAAVEQAAFDLILDLQATPVFTMPTPPQGYLHARPDDASARAAALAALPDMVGEFEKPKFFAYKESICAHSRSSKRGCNKCIEVCSAVAIASAGDKVVVNPHLCIGCGACATVCPSGAMSYQYPRVADRGAQLRSMLGAYRERDAAAAAPIVVLHNGGDGAAALAAIELAENVLPIEAWHVASIGLDVLLGAVVYGAQGVVVLSEGSEAPAYRAASEAEMQTGDIILNALGYTGSHFAWCDAASLAQRTHAIEKATACGKLATFHLSNDKRTTIEFAVEHLARHAPLAATPDEIALPANAMWGGVKVNEATCTMCLACAGACPVSALMDGGEAAEMPQLRFLERNCVQCGLCASTCPENAITLLPRLLMTDQRKTAVILNQTEPFNCISCGKALGTRKLIDTILGRLAGHSMFQAEGSLKRLQMCADCRVVDMMSNKNEMSILTGRTIE